MRSPQGPPDFFRIFQNFHIFDDLGPFQGLWAPKMVLGSKKWLIRGPQAPPDFFTIFRNFHIFDDFGLFQGLRAPKMILGAHRWLKSVHMVTLIVSRKFQNFHIFDPQGGGGGGVRGSYTRKLPKNIYYMLRNVTTPGLKQEWVL